jgi:phage/plasmid-like protein (TIGR03299 family)
MHDLNIKSNGDAAFYSLRESAWHGMGTVVNAPVSDPEVRRLAGLDWNVTTEPLLRQDLTPVDGFRATVRSDTKATLGVVGPSYTPVQNAELFDWLRGLDGYTDVTIETAGALGRGETVWVMGRCNDLKLDLGDGGIQPYMLLSNGHAGNRQVTIMPTTVRVVCSNTLRMAIGKGERKNDLSSGFQLRHTTNVAEAMKRVQEAYVATTNAWKVTEEALRFLASKQYSTEKLVKLMLRTFQPDVSEDEAEDITDESVRAKLIRETRENRLMTILGSKTCNAPAIRGTMYSALQAMTEYIEHETLVTVRETDGKLGPDEKKRALAMARFRSVNFGGNGDDAKGRAWDAALELAAS